jgi:N-carbamoylputrescine amidase
VRFCVGMLQMASLGVDQAANLDKAERFCRRAKDLDVHLALFPEMWNVGYTLQEDDPQGPDAWSRRAITLEDPFIGRCRELAVELELALGITFLEQSEEGPRNSVAVIDRRGDVVLTYSKVHSCDFDTEACLVPGDGFRVGTLNLAEGSVEVGAMICFDGEFPESARALMLEGAEVIVVPNACTLDDHRTQMTKVRAMENLVSIATANYAAPQADGHSVAFDPSRTTRTGGRSTTWSCVPARTRAWWWPSSTSTRCVGCESERPAGTPTASPIATAPSSHHSCESPSSAPTPGEGRGHHDRTARRSP